MEAGGGRIIRGGLNVAGWYEVRERTKGSRYWGQADRVVSTERIRTKLAAREELERLMDSGDYGYDWLFIVRVEVVHAKGRTAEESGWEAD
jgi:hypothetical protein